MLSGTMIGTKDGTKRVYVIFVPKLWGVILVWLTWALKGLFREF